MSRILYIIILIAASFFYPLYKDNLSYIVLVSVIALPLVMLIQLAICAKLLKCSIKKSSSVIFKGGEGEAQITLSNNSPFALSGVRVGIRVTYLPTGQTKQQSAEVPLPALSSQTVTVNISPKNCGEAAVYLEYVKVYDLLRLFSVKLFKREGLIDRVYILPKVSEKYSAEARTLMEARFESGGSENLLTGDSGAFGDVSGYREFMPGDRLSRLHHKLSSRFDKDIVKIMSPEGGGKFLLTADLSADMGGDNTALGDETALDRRDKRLEKMLSLAYYLAAEGARVYMAVPEGSPLADMNIGGVYALGCKNGADCLAAARALCGADFAGADFAGADLSGAARQAPVNEYVTVHIEDNNEETD